MKKKYLVLGFCLAFVTLGFAQNVTGTVLSVNNEPVEYANIVLLAQPDSTFITGTVSNASGGFSISLPVPTSKSYLIQITSIGYKSVCKLIQSGNVGNIILEDDALMLGEVVVKGDLPVTRLKAGAMITNIEGSVLEKVGTAQNLLDYIPGVNSQRGDLQVLGRGAPVVYINGRLMRDKSELDQLSAEDIKSIEVINNPGARYNASVKAVIRIYTKKPVGEGFGFNTRTFVEYDDKYWDALQQLNFNYRKGGLDIFGMLYFYQYKDWQGFTLIQDSYLDKHWKQAFKAEGAHKKQSFMTDFGMNYTFNSNHSMGFKYCYDRTPRERSLASFEAAVTENGVLYEHTSSMNAANGRKTRHSVNLYYNGKMKDWNIDFNSDLLWIGSKERQQADEVITLATVGGSEQVVTTFNEMSNQLYASKLILTHPLLGGEISFGGEFSYTDRTTDYRNLQGILANDDSEIKESNSVAFVEFSRELGKLQVQGGLRYEHVVFDYYDKGTHQDEQSKKYDNFFPSFSVSMPIGKAQLQLSYAQDIVRPGFYSLRNSVFYANHYTYETGNPLLRPSISHNVSLVGVYKWWKLSAAYARRENDVILTTVPYSEDDPNIVLFKPVNAQAYNTAHIMLNATPTVGLWSPRFTAMVQKQWFEAETPYGLMSLNRPQIYFRWQNSFKLPAEFLFTLNGDWSNQYDSQNSRSNESSWGIDIGLNKSFLDNQLTLQLNGYDVFLTRRRSQTSYMGRYYVMAKDEVLNSRSVAFTVRYRFNQGKSKYKGTGAGESQKNRL